MDGTLKRLPLAKKLESLDIRTVEDLLWYFPYRYDDFTRVVPIGNLRPGDMVAVEGIVAESKISRHWGRSGPPKRGSPWGGQFFETVVQDPSGSIRVIWFNQVYLARTLKRGTGIALAGKVYESKRGIYFANPAYEVIKTSNSPTPPLILRGGRGALLHTRRLVPVYRETKGLTSRWIRTLVHQYLPTAKQIADTLPPEIIAREKFPPIADALKTVHFPKDIKEAQQARNRFQFEELLLFQLHFTLERKGRETNRAHAVAFHQPLIKSFVDGLPFTLTDDQRKAAWHILQDLAHPYPMQRLLEGDVGSGKTIVAFLAVLEVAKAGLQTLYMAPTEVLARQHFVNAKKILTPHNITVGLATASAHEIMLPQAGKLIEKRVTKKTFQTLLKTGEIQLAIGTHALISHSVTCKDLALAIVDEQHRFGVKQRAALAARGSSAVMPHFLSMSATPIPRTLALAVYGDLDISRITQMPPGHEPIETQVVPPAKRNEAYAFVRSQVKQGRQVFVICPRIEPSLNTNSQQPTANSQQLEVGGWKSGVASAWADVKAVKEEYEKLSKTIFPDLRVAMLHGKLKPKEKDAVMKKFAAHEYDILVSTSVIEVGIDVPNATVMMIEGADRFGLATLHQFRGRVGRGEYKSYCLLLSDSAGAETHARLRALVGAHSGFELAQIDLELRGPGEFMGAEQSGIPDIAMEALKNPKLIEQAREDAKTIFAEDPDLARHPALKAKVQRLGGRVHGE